MPGLGDPLVRETRLAGIIDDALDALARGVADILNGGAESGERAARQVFNTLG